MVFSDGEDHADRWSSRLERLREQDIVVHAVAIGDPDQGHPVPAGKTAPAAYVSWRAGSLATLRYGAGGHRSPYRRSDREAGIGLGRSRRPSTKPRSSRGSQAPRGVPPRRSGRAVPALLVRRARAPRGRLLAARPRLELDLALDLELAASAEKPGSARRLMLAVAGLATGAGDAPPKIRAESAARGSLRGARPPTTPAGWTRRSLPSKRRSCVRRDRQSRVTTPPPRPFSSSGMPRPASSISRPASEPAASLRIKIDYALGNTALALGDIPAAIRSYDDCLASTARGAVLDAVRRDAAINRRFALEQAQSLAISQDQNSGDQPQSQRPDRRRAPNRSGSGDDPSPEGQPESDPGDGGTGPDADGQGDRPPREPAPDRRSRRWTIVAPGNPRRLTR